MYQECTLQWNYVFIITNNSKISSSQEPIEFMPESGCQDVKKFRKVCVIENISKYQRIYSKKLMLLSFQLLLWIRILTIENHPKFKNIDYYLLVYSQTSRRWVLDMYPVTYWQYLRCFEKEVFMWFQSHITSRYFRFLFLMCMWNNGVHCCCLTHLWTLIY